VSWAPFFSLADFTAKRDTGMLWSGSKEFSSKLTTSYTTLESTLTGYILDGLWWCPASANNTDEFDVSTPCAYYDNVPVGYYGLAPVWREASRLFAAGLTGDVTVLLQSRINYSDPNAVPQTYRLESIFATIELGALSMTDVTNVITLYMPGDRDYLNIENCNNGTLLRLRNDVMKKYNGTSVRYYCFDDNKLVMRLCTNNTNEHIKNIENGVDTLNELLDYANNFDFPTSQAYPECALGVLSYISGVDDATAIANVIQQNVTTLTMMLNSTQTQLNNTQMQLDNTKIQLQSTETVLNTTQTLLDTTQTELQNTQTELNSTQTMLDNAQTQLNGVQIELGSTQTQLNNTQAQLGSTQQELIASQIQLNDTQTQLHSVQAQLQQAQQRIAELERDNIRSDSILHTASVLFISVCVFITCNIL
jgi:hypothetical protein